MKLYSISISGKRYHFLGEIPLPLVSLIDDYCGSYNNGNSSDDPDKAFSELYRFVRYELKCNINPFDIDHVFRINL